MMQALATFGDAQMEYIAMQNAINGIIKDFSVTNLAEVKKVVDARPFSKTYKPWSKR